jgi:hypothetical protein
MTVGSIRLAVPTTLELFGKAGVRHRVIDLQYLGLPPLRIARDPCPGERDYAKTP